ncbi:MarR family winged helix-turn-helix transcriptional regulator [Actinomadura rayongensis]|uniref:MarR family transcriptional regulator n=1 Tax=Actinomadura rayongensis TaxID=1429076 RepID=A0A6I4W773_9ACTN|nr:MarR family transcriptional regulator [Actinomadura rayongensis]MXQ65311.1 MarR family transcriptional regulator [Actinomadura rayongensis]
MTEPRWLTATEQRSWRAYVDGSARLTELMDRDLKTRHGLSVSEYEILVRLSEAPGRSLRMAELAEHASQSRSRLSHTCARLEGKGLVRREDCPSDRRGVICLLTDEGFAALDRAARDHVEVVRTYLVDVVDPADLDAIGRAFDAVIKRIEAG